MRLHIYHEYYKIHVSVSTHRHKRAKQTCLLETLCSNSPQVPTSLDLPEPFQRSQGHGSDLGDARDDALKRQHMNPVIQSKRRILPRDLNTCHGISYNLDILFHKIHDLRWEDVETVSDSDLEHAGQSFRHKTRT